MATKKIDRLHIEHRQWCNQLDFIQDEIRYFLDELNQLNAQSDEIDCKQCISDYLLQLQVSDDKANFYKGAICKHEQYLAERAHFGQHLDLDHGVAESKINNFLKSYASLKVELKAFMAKTIHQNLQGV